MTDVQCWLCKKGWFYIMHNGTKDKKTGLPMCVCSQCGTKASVEAVRKHSYGQLRAKAEKPVDTAYQYSLDFKD